MQYTCVEVFSFIYHKIIIIYTDRQCLNVRFLSPSEDFCGSAARNHFIIKMHCVKVVLLYCFSVRFYTTLPCDIYTTTKIYRESTDKWKCWNIYLFVCVCVCARTFICVPFKVFISFQGFIFITEVQVRVRFRWRKFMFHSCFFFIQILFKMRMC